jgi:hypothetical protein
MSVDLAVWESSPPSSDEDALATFQELSGRYLDATGPIPPTPEIAEYVRLLLARYPDLDDDTVEVPWGSGPLMGNASGPIVYIDMKLNDVFEDGWRFCVETAVARGLVAFDPQGGAVANPDPNAPGPEEPLPPRPGRVYRWIYLRSWRFRFLRPLLPLARRFSRER